MLFVHKFFRMSLERPIYYVFLNKSINVLTIISMAANKFTQTTCSPKKLRLILLYSCSDYTINRNAAKWFFEKTDFRELFSNDVFVLSKWRM